MKLPPWKVLVVDDEPDVHAIARLSLKHFEFAGKRLRFFEAMSAQEARDILAVEHDIAVALIDVVMETDDAGLRLVEYIRNELHNDFIRLVIRTGQPGIAPERHVIEHYDIDDYKDKTELTTQKLYTTMRTALKSFRDLGIIDSNRKGLKKILDTTPTLYQPQEINKFFGNVLSQIIDLCKDNFIATITDGLLMTANDRQVIVQCGSGRFERLNDGGEVDVITQVCMGKLTHIENNGQLPTDALLIPLMGNANLLGFVYLEGARNLSPDDQDLIHILVNQCAAALENLQLYINLKEANHRTLNMLAVAEQARTMAESANRAKSTFLANMSHELRTPLNAILGYTDIIYEDAVDAGCEAIVSYLDEIKTAGNKLLGIISDILDISQIETSKVKLNLAEFLVVDILEEVVNAVQPIIKTIGNTLTVEYQKEQLGTLYADQQKVKQILLNLLNNATKFTHRGHITFTVIREPSQENGGTDWFSFQVTDTGIGIPTEKLESIFEAFNQADNSTTRRYEGTGLGLAISQHFSRLMGGHITVNSELGKGSVFTVHLPAWAVKLSI